MIKIDVKVGDTIKVGRFKNKSIVVKEIGEDDHGMPTINGRSVVTFRKNKASDMYKTKDKVGELLKNMGLPESE
tara:strand:+ start:372 stop:593 length:222 start_codon:yes stop_codon:yes gene_type:complete